MNDVENVISGKDNNIAKNCTFGGIRGKKGNISFGDYCTIHENCRFYTENEFKLGDYGTIHNNTLFQGYKPCFIGHNAWIGQNSIINATDTLKIGNNFAIGTSSKIWTHAFHGDLLLGCKIAVGIPDLESKSGEITIGDDFWGMGQITIGPGVKIGDKVIALSNSLITKDIPNNTIVGGVPAKPVKIDGDFKAYKNLNEHEKFDLMKKFATQFSQIKNVEIKIDNKNKILILGNREIIITVRDDVQRDVDVSYFDIIKRTYTKKHNYLEREFMSFIIGYRARFIPE
jgi:acetyltransferase-like isoleucine patch superfamily enzyme